jgi:hypothetical protein
MRAACAALRAASRASAEAPCCSGSSAGAAARALATAASPLRYAAPHAAPHARTLLRHAAAPLSRGFACRTKFDAPPPKMARNAHATHSSRAGTAPRGRVASLARAAERMRRRAARR